MSDKVEKRRYSRCSISLCIQVRLDTGVLVEGRTCDVSLNGLFFETERTLPLGSHVKIKMTVGCDADKTDIHCTGSVARLDDRGVAIEIDAINDDDISRLCRLIHEAAEDVGLMEEEIERRLGKPYASLFPDTNMDQ